MNDEDSTVHQSLNPLRKHRQLTLPLPRGRPMTSAAMVFPRAHGTPQDTPACYSHFHVFSRGADFFKMNVSSSLNLSAWQIPLEKKTKTKKQKQNWLQQYTSSCGPERVLWASPRVVSEGLTSLVSPLGEWSGGHSGVGSNRASV